MFCVRGAGLDFIKVIETVKGFITCNIGEASSYDVNFLIFRLTMPTGNYIVEMIRHTHTNHTCLMTTSKNLMANALE